MYFSNQHERRSRGRFSSVFAVQHDSADTKRSRHFGDLGETGPDEADLQVWEKKNRTNSLFYNIINAISKARDKLSPINYIYIGILFTRVIYRGAPRSNNASLRNR